MLDPDAVWKEVGLLPGSVVVEVGAGTGFFAFPAARRVGPTGKVYAVDISRELVDLLRERAVSEHLPQVEAVESSATSIPLPSGLADVVLMATVLHDVPGSTVAEAVRLLRPGGTFVNLDWEIWESPMGPPLEIRLTPEQAAERLAEAGLGLERSWKVGPYHYGQVLRRREPGAVPGPQGP